MSQSSIDSELHERRLSVILAADVAMPHGNPKKFSSFRIDPELLDAVRALTTNVTQAVEEGLRLWVAQRPAPTARRDAKQHQGQPRGCRLMAHGVVYANRSKRRPP